MLKLIFQLASFGRPFYGITNAASNLGADSRVPIARIPYFVPHFEIPNMETEEGCRGGYVVGGRPG